MSNGILISPIKDSNSQCDYKDGCHNNATIKVVFMGCILWVCEEHFNMVMKGGIREGKPPVVYSHEKYTAMERLINAAKRLDETATYVKPQDDGPPVQVAAPAEIFKEFKEALKGVKDV